MNLNHTISAPLPWDVHWLPDTETFSRLSSGPKDLLSDRCILSCPSMDLVTCLLDFRLNFASNRSIVPRLAASLAACAQLSALGTVWSIFLNLFSIVQLYLIHILNMYCCCIRCYPVQPRDTGCGLCRDYESSWPQSTVSPSTSTGCWVTVKARLALWWVNSITETLMYYYCNNTDCNEQWTHRIGQGSFRGLKMTHDWS